MNKQDLQDLANKIEWEGGLWAYLLGYGGSLDGVISAELESEFVALASKVEAEVEKALPEPE